MTHRLVLLDPMAPDRLEGFRENLPQGFTLANAASRSASDQLEAIRGATFAITGGVPIGAEMMRVGAESGLRAVHKWGVGYDNIHVETARSLGVRVLRTTGSNSVAVAETAVGLMLALLRNIVEGHGALSKGDWAKSRLAPGCTLVSNKTVGLVGLGLIGQAVARMLGGFGCRVLYAKPTPLPAGQEAALGVGHVPLPQLLAEADLVSLHCALTPATERLIDAAALRAMRPGSYLINTARGGIVDEAALCDAILSGHLAGAAFDVFDEEPLPPNHRLLSLPRTIVTPHIAALAAENYLKSVRRMLANLAAIAEGRDPAPLDVVV